jgi:hypothetical protein
MSMTYGPRNPLHAAKRPERESDHSPPADAKVIAQNCLPYPTAQLHGVMRN